MPTQQEVEVLVNEIQPGKIYQVKDSDSRTLCIDNKGWAGWYWARLKRNPAGDQIARVSFEARPGGKFRMKQHMQHPDNRGLMLFSRYATDDAAVCFAQPEYEKDHFHLELTPVTSGEFITFTAEVNGESFQLAFQCSGDDTGLVISKSSTRQLKIKVHPTN